MPRFKVKENHHERFLSGTLMLHQPEEFVKERVLEHVYDAGVYWTVTISACERVWDDREITAYTPELRRRHFPDPDWLGEEIPE